MLISKGITEGEIITLKLSSGEELIARLTEETATHYKISKPLVIGMGNQGPGLMPWLYTTNPESDVPVSKANVMVVVTSDKQYADMFIESTTSIQLV